MVSRCRALFLVIWVSFFAACSGTVSGSFYSDVNGDKIKSSVDEPVAYMQYEVTRDGERVGTGVTSSLGGFSFVAKKSGYYCVNAIKGSSYPVEVASRSLASASTMKASTTTCTTITDCQTGEVCTDSKCVTKTCSSNTDCSGGQVCSNNKCWTSCTSSNQCLNEEVCTDSRCQKKTSDSATTTTETTKPTVVSDGKTCVDVKHGKDGLDVPISVSYTNISRLTPLEKIILPLGKSTTVSFYYPRTCKCNEVSLPSVVKLSDSNVSPSAASMFDISTAPPKEIAGLEFDVDEAKLVQKTINVTAIKVGSGFIEPIPDCPIEGIELPKREIEVSLVYPEMTQSIDDATGAVASGNLKAGDNFLINVNINNATGTAFDKATLTVTPDAALKGFVEVDRQSVPLCRFRGAAFDCDLTLKAGDVLTRQFKATLPDTLSADTTFKVESSLKCVSGATEKEIIPLPISLTVKAAPPAEETE